MSKVLKFQAITSGAYRADEIEALENAFIDWINEVDEDVIEGTEDTSVIENDLKPEIVISDEVRAQIIKEFLAEYRIQIDAKFRFVDGERKPLGDNIGETYRFEGFTQA